MKVLRCIADWIAWAALGALLLLWAFALVAHARAKADAMVPLNCLHEVKITDFTKPCKVDAKNQNMARCDGVIIHFACIQYEGTH